MPFFRLFIKLGLAQFAIQLRSIIAITKPILKVLSFILEWVAKFSDWFTTLISKPINAFFQWIFRQFDWLFDKIGKFAEWLGLDMKMPQFGMPGKQTGDSLVQQGGEDSARRNTTTIDMNISQTFAGGEGSSIGMGGAAAQMKDAARAAFSLEVRKVLVGAI